VAAAIDEWTGAAGFDLRGICYITAEFVIYNSVNLLHNFL